MFGFYSNFDNRGNYLNPLFPEDRAMKDRPREEWVLIAQKNNMPYEAGDEDARRFWYRDTMRFLRRKLRTEGQLWFPEGLIKCNVWFERHSE